MAGPRDQCLTAEDLDRLSGGCPPSEADREHLASCARCRSKLEDSDRDAEFLGRVRAVATSVLAPEGAPRIPGYRFLERLNSGAQGVVYRAVQEATARVVAVKVLGATGDGSAVSSRERGRAEREGEIAARLRHPNVISVFESRTLSDGRVAMVMEFVDGLPLDLWTPPGESDQERLVAMLRVMVAICNGVHHAHLNGVIHRDLKPDNVLVTHDGRPVVVDFGVARVDGLHTTRTGEFAGTPAYASPEQVSGKPDSIDALTDVYSLGVILYRLLCGAMPYDLHGSLFDIARTITETHPIPIRTRNPAIPQDLEAIALRALRKQRTERYQSAVGMALDIERFLRGAPVEARSGSGWYVLRKAVFMNKRRLGWAAAMVVLGIGGALAVALSLADAASAEKRAAAERDQAQAVAELLREILPGVPQESSKIAVRGGPVATGLRRLHYRLETGAFADRPGVDQALRRIWGGIYSGLGEGRGLALVPFAEVSLRSGLVELRRNHPGPSVEIAATLHELAGVLRVRGRLDEAERSCREALEMREALLGEQSIDVAQSRLLLALVLRDRDRGDEAVAEAERAEAVLRHSSERGADLGVAASLMLRARVMIAEGRTVAATSLVEEALVRRMQNLALDDLEVLSALSLAATLAADDPTTHLGAALVSAYGQSGMVLDAEVQSDRHALEQPMIDVPNAPAVTGKTAAIKRLARVARTVLPENDPANARAMVSVMNAAEDEWLQDERIEAADEAATLFTKIYGPTDPRALVCLDEAAMTLALANHPEKAIEYIRRGMTIRDSVPPSARDPLIDGNSVRMLGWCLALSGRIDEALPVCREAVDLLRSELGDDHYLVALSQAALAYCLVETGHPEEGERVSGEAMAAMSRSRAGSDDQRAHVELVRGHALLAVGRGAEALPILTAAWNRCYNYFPDEFVWRRMLLEDADRALAESESTDDQAIWLARVNP